MVYETMDELSERFIECGAARFPGSSQVQTQTGWTSTAFLTASFPEGKGENPSDGLVYFKTAHHTEFAPEWPVATDWPLVIRSLRSSLGMTQASFAAAAEIGTATVERWETGRSVPFGGDALQLLSLAAPLVDEPVQRGQLLNVAAAAVLPRITRPTATYKGTEIVNWLRSGKHDHRSLGDALLHTLREARILVPVEETGNELVDDEYFPLAGNLRGAAEEPAWLPEFIRLGSRLETSDRQVIVHLMRRLGRDR